MAATPHHNDLPIDMHILLVTFFLFLLILPFTTCNSVHDLLTSRGLPAGLFPQNVKSYDLDHNDHLQVFLEEPCVAKFETRVFFESVGIKVIDPSSGLILFDIGLAFKQLSLSLFEEPPICIPKGTHTT
ncbi:hypothetical protein HanPI659440_Chr01g0005341 [Helianthus annuus]|uniref:Transmembrane protein n=1 Tax=Helianthus annuus TaxID=4232 RepID=A0A251VN82_HELAN|nr:hypothetical protein HanXRQr2_Chr01g0006201 [Helianthus annuus]KAJ0610551.1 hypothetical protein HanHA300_Chr01g0005011 [Helianthus annuus]KAJ0621283.1 hypothetical protein HanIR_Chr01g0006921 [Helianthus annuus]KAJ0625798.1 hypothetical protein HanHA89_Chr01g0005681 [Helianthus annuus]KAJ0782161.1 hypothetical protein HanLR1_Chr01g0004961 [Helianthus annuus]